MLIKVIGGGLGHNFLLTGEAKSALESCGLVLAGKRLAGLVGEYTNKVMVAEVDETIEIIRSRLNQDEAMGGEVIGGNEVIGVVVSGDVGFYSLSSQLRDKFPQAEMDFINGLSSLQYFTAKIKKNYAGLKTVTAHGRQINIVALVNYNERLFVLTGGKNNTADILNELFEAGLDDLQVWVGENLGSDAEKISSGTIVDLKSRTYASLSVIYLENKSHIKPWIRISDEEFIRGQIPMTKAEVRDICLARLGLEPSDVVYDVGAGTGSVSIMMARAAYEGQVWAIERNDEGLELIQQNRAKFKAHNLTVVGGSAPEALINLPRPNKVFIGGSGGNLPEIIDVCLAKNSRAKIVVTAIALETIGGALSKLKKLGRHFQVTMINSATSSQSSTHTLMKANNPIFIITSEPGSDYDQS